MRQNSSETSCLSLALRKVLGKGWKKQSRNVITLSKHHKVAVFWSRKWHHSHGSMNTGRLVFGLQKAPSPHRLWNRPIIDCFALEWSIFPTVICLGPGHPVSGFKIAQIVATWSTHHSDFVSKHHAGPSGPSSHFSSPSPGRIAQQGSPGASPLGSSCCAPLPSVSSFRKRPSLTPHPKHWWARPRATAPADCRSHAPGLSAVFRRRLEAKWLRHLHGHHEWCCSSARSDAFTWCKQLMMVWLLKFRPTATFSRRLSGNIGTTCGSKATEPLPWIWPLNSDSLPARARKRVVFPEPLAPTIATNCLGTTLNEMSCNRGLLFLLRHKSTTFKLLCGRHVVPLVGIGFGAVSMVSWFIVLMVSPHSLISMRPWSKSRSDNAKLIDMTNDAW